MALERHRDVARVWDWLPVFRAAAEYESLQRAALALAASPSALSRTIKLLEEALGQVLFVRSPAGLTLTADGHRLLEATRDAMRRVHDGLRPLGEQPLRLATTSVTLEPLLFDAAIVALPSAPFRLSSCTPAEVGEHLRCGEVDFVLTEHEPRDLDVAALPPLRLVVAHRHDGPRRATLEGEPWDGASVVRTVEQALRFDQALLPHPSVPVGWRVSTTLRSRPVFALRRKDLVEPPAWARALVDALAQSLE